MRLLQVGKFIKPAVGGIETVVHELCRGLAARDDTNVTCLVSNVESKTVIDEMGGFKVIRAASYGSFASTALSPGFARLGKKVEADLVHFHLPNPLATVSFSEIRILYKPSLKKFLAGSSKIIVSSENLIHSSPVLQEFKSKCMVIPFGIDTSHLELNDVQNAKVKDMKSRFKSGLVLFVGRLVKYKGLDILMRALADTDAHLMVVGQGPERLALEKLASDLELSDRVHFAGYVPQQDLGIYYHACDVFALTSVDDSEAFGLSLLDALACGKPLITSILPTGISQINRDRETGFQVPVGDSAEIASRINLLLSDVRVREEMGLQGKLHFKNSFSLKHMIDSHVELYSEILNFDK
jgi:glycosyltransferase involved in cell wall biosynthesis